MSFVAAVNWTPQQSIVNTWDDGVRGSSLDVAMDMLPGGVILVKVSGKDRRTDAVFRFRPGDPQYDQWLHRYETATEKN